MSIWITDNPLIYSHQLVRIFRTFHIFHTFFHEVTALWESLHGNLKDRGKIELWKEIGTRRIFSIRKWSVKNWGSDSIFSYAPILLAISKYLVSEQFVAESGEH